MQRILKKRYLLILAVAVIVSIPGQLGAAQDTREAAFTPWSGYWWPTTEGALATGDGYRNHPAPIEKYELYRDGSYPGEATRWYLTHDYDPQALGWYGLCHAWAAAAVYEHIEFKPSAIDNIIFYVGDKKGLITACHDTDASIRENAQTPDIFHYWLLRYIQDEGVDFYAELDPSEEVWNYPVYKYEMTTSETGGAMDVICKIWYADDMVSPDFQGTKARTKTYTYTLSMVGSEITGGEWTGNSHTDHPTQLRLPVTPATPNVHLDYETIRELAATIDDDLESNDPVNITPGGYNLILLNEDVYTIDCHEGDQVMVNLEKIDDMTEPVSIIVTDDQGNTVASESVSSTAEMRFSAASPPYEVRIFRSDYGEGGIYRLEIDFQKAFEFINLKVQKGFGWGGYAITNADESICETVYVVGYRQDNSAIQTYFGPFSLSPGEKRIFLVSDFPVRNSEKNDLFGVKILADKPLYVTNLTGYYEKNMSCLDGGGDAGCQLVIPDTASAWNFSKQISWGIHNSDTREATVSLARYSSDGELKDEVTSIIPANQAIFYNGSASPFSGNVDNGWIRVTGADENCRLKGQVEWLINGVTTAETLSPLKSGQEFLVPHVAQDSFWTMRITVINTADVENSIELDFVNGELISTAQVLLGPGEKKTVAIDDIIDAGLHTLSDSSLIIRSSAEMTGFYAFETPADHVYYPLIAADFLHEDLTLPHVATGNYWWTAINLFNPTSTPVDFRLKPYDSQGQPMADHQVEMHLDAMKKDVFTLASRFGAISTQVAFLKIQVIKGPGIVGVYGMGNRNCSMLSGSVLQ